MRRGTWRTWVAFVLLGWRALNDSAAAEPVPGIPAPEAPAAPVYRNPTPAGTSRRTNSYELKVAERWFLNLPRGQRFDASGLLRRRDGHLYTVNDKTPGLYRIDFRSDGSADLTRDPAWFTPEQLAVLSVGKIGHWDIEGIAEDPEGRIYFCEELNRWVLRGDPRTGKLEKLPIDWTPVKKYFSKDLNSSWEGIAAGADGNLYLANEWETGRLIVVDPVNFRVTSDFKVTPLGHPSRDVTYSDLSWFENDLWVLCRQSRHVLRVDPAAHRVKSDFNYASIEISSEYGYATLIPYGQFEGLSVDAKDIWLVIDNNGSARIASRTDTRPTLFRCARPDR